MFAAWKGNAAELSLLKAPLQLIPSSPYTKCRNEMLNELFVRLYK